MEVSRKEVDIAHGKDLIDKEGSSYKLIDPNKPIYNYIRADGELVSFREEKTRFSPTKEEFTKLLLDINGILSKKTNEHFEDRLKYLITFLREKAYYYAVATPITEKRDRLSKFSQTLKSLASYMNTDEFEQIQFDLTHYVTRRMFDDGIEDPAYNLQQFAILMSEICDQANEDMKGYKPSFTPNTMRQILAEELARELDNIGEKPTKYKKGKYFKILRAVLEMIPCRIEGQIVSISVPENLFKVASKAIDDYPNKEPYHLLNFD